MRRNSNSKQRPRCPVSHCVPFWPAERIHGARRWIARTHCARVARATMRSVGDRRISRARLATGNDLMLFGAHGLLLHAIMHAWRVHSLVDAVTRGPKRHADANGNVYTLLRRPHAAFRDEPSPPDRMDFLGRKWKILTRWILRSIFI